MERLKNMKETLVGIVQTQLANIQNVDTKELGEAIDMIKDLEEAMYYCSIVKAMEEPDFTKMYYSEKTPRTYPPYERELPLDLRDSREGRSPISRKMYMESKEMHRGRDEQVRELERYMQELSSDITEMIEDATPEEKQMLEKKMAQLTSRISQLNK